MVCPICVSTTGIIVFGKLIGIPESIIFTLIGILITSFSFSFTSYINNKYDKNIKKIIILIIITLITILSYYPLGYLW